MQFENYMKIKDWNLMFLESNEMLDFYNIVKLKFYEKNLDIPYNFFLLKYFKLSLDNLKYCVLDKDYKTTKINIENLKKLLNNFQKIYEKSKK
jgi:hypothetical protein